MTEIIDIFDEDMKHVGTMEKVRAHNENRWHKSVHIWITDGKNVLVQLRAAGKREFPNLWDISAAGHLPAGEDPLQGAKREFEEELGIPWTFGDIKEDCVIKNKNEFQYMYFIKTKLDIKKLNIQKDELADIKWVPFAEFEKLLCSDKHVPNPEHYRRAVLAGLKGVMA